MTSWKSDPVEFSELQRLNELLPDDLRSQVAIGRSTDVNPTLIKTKRSSKNRFSIQIDLASWQQLSIRQCDLLFWHEVARIQGRSISQSSWEFIVLGIGFAFGLTEFISQNVLALSVTLAVTGLAGYQLYQRNRGEHSLREAAAADRGAIQLAVQFGYSQAEAYESLYSGLKILAKTAQKFHWKKYQVRLRVLEISASDNFAVDKDVAFQSETQAKKRDLNIPLLFPVQ